MKHRFTIILQVAVLLLIAVLLHNRWVTPRISFDQMRQLVALENISQGHGITFQIVGELTTIEHNSSFPPGCYALLLPFYELANDPILLHRIFEIIGLLMLIHQFYLLGKLVERRYQLHNGALFFMLFVLVQLNPLRVSGFTDIWSLLFFITAFRMSLSLPHRSILWLVIIGVLSFASVGFRFAYYPLAFIPPLLLLIGKGLRDWRMYVPVGTLVLLLGSMKLFDRFYFKGQNHLEETLNGSIWNFSHLQQMEPLGFNAFFSEHVLFGFLNLSRFGANANWNLKFLVLLLSTIIILVLIVLTVKCLAAQSKPGFYPDRLLIGIAATVFINLGFITALSIYFPSHSDNHMYTWSLIWRYFAPAYIFLQLLAVMLWYRSGKGWERLTVRSLVIISLCFQVAYLTSFTIRFSLIDTWSNYVRLYDRPEMPEVMKNYELLRTDHNRMIAIPEEHLSYDYLSIYYLSGNPHVISYLEKECPECLR